MQIFSFRCFFCIGGNGQNSNKKAGELEGYINELEEKKITGIQGELDSYLE